MTELFGREAGSIRRQPAEGFARARYLLAALLFFVSMLFVSSWAGVSAQTTPELRIGLHEADTHASAQQIESLSAFAFQPMAEGALALHGGPGKAIWLRLDADLPAIKDDDARLTLWVNRAAVDRLVLHRTVDGAQAAYPRVDFFVPRDSGVEHDSGYAFVLPRGIKGPTTMYLEVVAQGDLSLSVRIRSETEVVASDRGAVMLLTALYTGLILLLLIGGGMYIALRDRLYLYYLFYIAALLAFLLARNGQLYELPGIGDWGHWRVLGLCALANALAAATVVIARGFAGLSRSASGLDRLLAWFPVVPAILVLVCLFNRPSITGVLQVASTLDLLGAIVLAAVATAVAWRYKRHLATPMLLMWLFVLTVDCIRAMADWGLSASGESAQYVDQVMAALNALLMGFVLTDRIIEFRLQRDRARLAKDQVDASLKMERERLKFIEALHSNLRDAPSGDQEWLAFRRLLEVVRELVPQHSSAVALHSFHDNDLLLCEPNATRDAYQSLLATRGGAFKGISRSQLPMQLRVDSPIPVDGQAPDLIQFAVLPLPLTAPAWGMLLIERRGWQGFEREELAIASELAQKATRAVEDAANDRVLRINAEFDTLTAVFNRRTMDNRLAAYFKESILRRAALVAMFVDLDDLKGINDTFGYSAGDKCLRALADVMKAHCGTVGVVGRYSGDQFVVILPDFNPDQVRRWVEAMRAEATSKDMVFGTKTMHMRVSIGVASRLAEDADVHQLVERADKALTNARRTSSGQSQAAPIQSVAGGRSMQ
ncbi:MAG TPA: diguanylate cyclase [Xanthomonadaceae bacterium]|nr:diguanylate cyclase [Xanthomonadaceae bacterium]